MAVEELRDLVTCDPRGPRRQQNRVAVTIVESLRYGLYAALASACSEIRSSRYLATP